MKPLAVVPREMRRSGIREVMELAASVPGCIHLEVGEPDFDTPVPVRDAAVRAMAEGYTRYTPNAGLPSIRSAIAETRSARHATTVSPDEVVVTPGAVCALATAILALVNPDDEVLLPDPGWPNYTSMVQLARGRVVYYPLAQQQGYVADPDAVARLITGQTKAIVINTPANPTGAVFPPEVVRAIVRLAKDRDLYVVSDEVYEDFVFEGTHETAAMSDADGRVIVVGGFSKSYAMTGWRLGYAVAAAPIASLIAKLQEPLVSCASSIAQRAAETALRLPIADVQAMCDEYRRRRDLVQGILEPAGLLAAVPHGAFYALVDLRSVGLDSRDMARRLLLEAGVACAPGDTFGEQGAGLVRISLATSTADLEEGCIRIRGFVSHAIPSTS